MKWRNTVWIVAFGLLAVGAWWAGYLAWLWFGTHPRPAARTFWAFTNEWGVFLGIVATILVGLLAAFIPSRVEAQVESITKRLQQPLENFEAIYGKALELLLWLEDKPNSTFVMTSATPVFGIELSIDDRKQWRDALRRRIVTGDQQAQPKTGLLCLNPDSDDGLRNSPLWDFCRELERTGLLKKSEVHTAGDLFRRSMDAFAEFAGLAIHEGFELRCGPAPLLHFVLAQNADGRSKGVLYFTGIPERSTGLVVSGFATEDDRWIRLINVVYTFMKSQSWNILSAFKEDHRNDLQKARCMELLEYQLKHEMEYDVTVGGYHITVFLDVFPPELGYGVINLLTTLRRVGETLQRALPKRSLVGIDVGTGTGILSLELAQHCSKVYATDISRTAVHNAEENVKRRTENPANARELQIRVFHGNLLDPVSQIAHNAVVVAVFNYPFYPSPLAVFNAAGRATAGITIVRQFFKAVSRLVPKDTVLVLPYSTIAGENNPSTVGRESGFSELTVLETPQGDSVHLFTMSSVLLNALRPLAVAKPNRSSDENGGSLQE